MKVVEWRGKPIFVVKMAEKYQLVEKDEFADSIVQEAEEKEKN